jgi:hypothetical protein
MWNYGTPFPPGQGAPPPLDRRFEGRDYDRDRDHDRFYRERDDFFRDRDWRGQLFARIRRDLDYASRESFRGDDQYRLDCTYRELDDLQRDYSSGRWDARSLDDVIQALDRVVDDNRLDQRAREILRDDLEPSPGSPRPPVSGCGRPQRRATAARLRDPESDQSEPVDLSMALFGAAPGRTVSDIWG